jgi:hypothetical protein
MTLRFLTQSMNTGKLSARAFGRSSKYNISHVVNLFLQFYLKNWQMGEMSQRRRN